MELLHLLFSHSLHQTEKFINPHAYSLVRVKKKMNIKVQPQIPQTNPQNQNNAKVQPRIPQTNPQNQNINNLQTYQLQQDQSEVFVVKASMKASKVALRMEKMLLLKKKITLTALGYAMVQLLDSVMLIKKDLAKFSIDVRVQLELFEKEEVLSDGKKKIISGIRAILQI